MLFRILLSLIFSSVVFHSLAWGQISDDLEFNLDFNSATVALPKIYKPSIDLSGRGVTRDQAWPQSLASQEALDRWQSDLKFNNFYRLQFNFWELWQLANDPALQDKFLNNYEETIKRVNDSGGTVLLNLFGTPFGLGRVLDNKSAPYNLKEYKGLVKNIVRRLSCEKKYNIWYEVWNAPDLEDFFLGERAEYFNLYRVVAEAIKELRQEYKIKIPLGGPSTSAWFKNIEPNTILSPENSLIYELIKYCANYHLPLDFITWHAYSSDPQEDQPGTIYNKSSVKLIRDWLSYFHFDSQLPLIISEWNFDGAANILAERGKQAQVAASYIPARLKNMWEAQIDYQTYFCLEDFGGDRKSIARNLGLATFDLGRAESKSSFKSSYNLFRLLNLFGQNLLVGGLNDHFVGVIATKSQDYLAVLVYNYIDQQSALNYLSRNIVYLNSADRKALLNIIKSDRIQKVISGQLDLATLRLSPKAKEMLMQAIELNHAVNKFTTSNRKLKISIKGLKEIYLLSKYVIDNKCSRDCEFKSSEDKDVDFNQEYAQVLELAPYSVQMFIFKKKPAEIKVETKAGPAQEKIAPVENKDVKNQ